MHTWLRCTTRVVALSITAATLLTAIAATQLRVASPDGRNQLTVEIHDGCPYYSLNRDTHPLFLPSRLGWHSGTRRRCSTACGSRTRRAARTTRPGPSRGARWPACGITTTS